MSDILAFLTIAYDSIEMLLIARFEFKKRVGSLSPRNVLLVDKLPSIRLHPFAHRLCCRVSISRKLLEDKGQKA